MLTKYAKPGELVIRSKKPVAALALYTPYTLPDIVYVNYCGAKLQDKAARRTSDSALYTLPVVISMLTL